MPPSCPASFKCDDPETGKLLEIIGIKKFKALQNAFGGKRIWIPKPGSRIPCGICLHRDDCIRHWKQQGLSVARISRHLNMSPKTIYHILGAKNASPSKEPQC